MAQSSGLIFFFEVFVLEDVGCGAYEPETHLVFAGFAIGEVLAADHYDFMHFAMIAVVNDLIDSRLAYTVSGTISAIIRTAAPVSWPLETGALELKVASWKTTAWRSHIKTRVLLARG